jgi:hypothetical protein
MSKYEEVLSDESLRRTGLFEIKAIFCTEGAQSKQRRILA